VRVRRYLRRRRARVGVHLNSIALDENPERLRLTLRRMENLIEGIA